MQEALLQCFGKHTTASRTVSINLSTSKFSNNAIRNTKYTWYNWFILALLEQFSLHMNQYFLLLACLQLWKEITPVSPVATWTPLIIIVGLAICKELLDDFYRWRADRRSNYTNCYVYKRGKKSKVKKLHASNYEM